MKIIKSTAFLCIGLAFSACSLGEANGGDKTRDFGSGFFGRGEKDLADLQAGIWVDPNGCDHWIIDDGIEGYLSARLDAKTGKPVCSGAAPPGYATGEFKGGRDVNDPI
jgi:hypothetical protein